MNGVAELCGHAPTCSADIGSQVMARARHKPPSSARAIAAYNCGARMAEWQNPTVADMACRGESLRDYMTEAERMAYRLCTDAFWWRYWWQGYQFGARDRGV